MKKRPLTYTVLAAAAMISLGVSASLAQGGNAGGGGGGGGGAVTDTVAPAPPPPPVVDPVVVPVDPAVVVPAAQTPPPPPPPPAPVVLPSADLQLTGRASTGSPVPGSSYSFNYTIKNSGTGTASNVVFTSEAPTFYTGWTLNGQQQTGCEAEGLGTAVPGGNNVVCTIPTLAKGASVNIVIMAIAPEVAARVTSSGSVLADNPDPNGVNNTASGSITVKAPSGSVCKGGACDSVPSVQAAPCAALTAVSAPVGYYLTYAAIWNTFTLQSCSSGSETVSIQVQELNQLTGVVDYDVTWYVTLSPSQNYSMVLDNDFAPNDTPYTISYTVRDASGNQLDLSSLVATTPPKN
jgi:hypothetical protein